jgi:transcriptional regulator with XRE-family HTH domain
MIRPRPHKTRAMLTSVGRCVRAHRIARRLTQQELSQKARVNPKHLSALECGGENSTLVTLARIAEALDCTLTDLMQTEPSTSYVVLSAEDMRRVRQAIRVLDTATAHVCVDPSSAEVGNL